MAPNNLTTGQKKWMAQQLRHVKSLKTEAGKKRFLDAVLEDLNKDEEDTKPKTYIARDMTVDQVVEIFSLKEPTELELDLHKDIYDPPKYLIANLKRLKIANYEKETEAYSRIAIDYMIVACMVEYKNFLSKKSELPTNQSKVPVNDPTATISPELRQSELPTNDLHDQKTVNQATEIAGPANVAPATPLMAPKSIQPLPLKVFPEMGLSVAVLNRGKERTISGIADWAISYGERTSLDNGAVLLAVEAKKPELVEQAHAQLLAYLATIRQLRIQANKTNVMTQGFYSNGVIYRFLIIRNDGTVVKSNLYDISLHGNLKKVFNFLLGMLITAAESSPNTSPTKQGEQQDKRIENFDREVYVEVFQDILVDEISEYEEDGGEDLPDIDFAE